MKKYMFVLFGPSRAGKSALTKAVVNILPDYLEIIKAAVTRPKRENDPDDNLHNYFLSVDQFKEKIENGSFAEAAGYTNNYYGFERLVIEDALKRKHGICSCTEDGILILKGAGYPLIPVKITPVGGDNIRESFYGEHPGRKMADQKRAKIKIDYQVEIFNSFSPGGLAESIQNFTDFITDFVKL